MTLLNLAELDDPRLDQIGGKARHVRWLIEHSVPCPPSWVLAAGSPLPTAESLGATLRDGPWAVRSSAAVEDGSEASYAGQFHTVLDVADLDGVVAAIEEVRASAFEGIADAYRERTGDGAPVEMAVLIQPMVTPVVSGVAFSRNPITGLNEVVLEAVEGRGDALVGEGITPERWIERWGGWSVRPAEESVLPEQVATAIAEQTRDIADRFGAPADLEWVWDGSDVWWMQLRPITGLGEVSVYSNRISREVMPGMIKPLVWSVNVPVVNAAWIRLFTEFIGPNDLRPDDLAKQFAYRSYFNMGTIGKIFEALGMPRDALEMLLGLPSDSRPQFRPGLGTLRHVPRMLVSGVRLLRYGRRVGADVESLRARYGPFVASDLRSRSDSALLDEIDALAEVTIESAYSNIVTPLLANLWVGVFRRMLGRHVDDAQELELELTDPSNPYDPTPSLAALHAGITAVEGLAAAAEGGGVEALPAGIRDEFDEFLDRFGLLSDSGNDFSVPTWREQPDRVLGLALHHGEATGGRRFQRWASAIKDVGWVRRAMLRWTHRRARAFVGHREAVSFMYTGGYGLFRRHWLEVGRRLAERGLVEEAGDVMFLTAEEARSALLGAGGSVAGLVSGRRDEMERLLDVAMPETIFGDDFFAVEPSSVDVDRLEGVATSRGRHRGTLRVVKGIEDGPRVAPGDVIAVPYSDVGWTPIFARAGAVIAEAGGMLSHSSIVAREYGIPCVVQVPHATLLPDGATVVVDGYSGTITVESLPD